MKALSPFRSEVESQLNDIATEGDSHREARLEDFHRKVLENAYAVPFLVEEDVILASNRISLERFNPFDMRLRFYDVVWK